MQGSPSFRDLGKLALCSFGLLSWGGVSAAQQVDFSRDIRPILSDRCYQCHGPDAEERATDLRLDDKQIARSKLESESIAIVPGDIESSEIIRRVTSNDPDIKMPPPDSGKRLSAKEVLLLTNWVKQGAVWREHWAFIRPQRPPLPRTKHPWPTQTPIDAFVYARLEQAGLKPMPTAEKSALIRRVTFDLTGLPPTIREVDAFLADTSERAYEKLVDRLLKSPRYGEHMARYWLDVARYGDTHGLHLDNIRSLWPYRDWVIDAFNANMPFDQFTVEQLAGDLLPEPSLQQMIATGFNRCNVTTSEGGSIRKEYRVRYAIDRVETTSTVWMGLTTGCAVCHDHKFDPISQTEFYRLFAYFHSFAEDAMDGNALLPPPVIAAPTKEQERQLEALDQQIARARDEIRAKVAAYEYTEPTEPPGEEQTEREEFVWIEDDTPAGARRQGNSPWKFVGKEQGKVLSGTRASTRTASGLSQHFFTNAKPGLRIGSDDVLFAHVYLDPANPPKQIMLQFNDGNWEHRAVWGEDLIDWGSKDSASRRSFGGLPETGKWVRLEVPVDKVGLKPGAVVHGWAFTQFDGATYWDKAGIITSTPQSGREYRSLLAWERAEAKIQKSSLPKPVRAALKVARDKRSDAQQRLVRDYFLEKVHSESRKALAPLEQQLSRWEDEKKTLEASVAKTMVMGDKPKPLDTFVLKRGQYDQEDKSRKVEPGVPGILSPLPDKAPPNRLGLAKWLVDSSHPLTARVTVNRFWQQYFGVGIVKTAEDFGSQGEWPSHPELLDWLAVEFIDSGWDVKQLQKLIVMSAAYRQSARLTAEALEKDPANRLLSRGPRFRLDAEMVRDNSLALSGLLVEKVGGRSVKPYQPAGLWKAVGYSGSNTVRFVRDKGESLYRRSMYTFWKRTAPPPTMRIFDAPSRESCAVRRSRTNTPQQALLLMNDEQFVEAARFFAERILKQGGKTAKERIVFAFRTATARRPDEAELAIFQDVLAKHLREFKSDENAALKLLSVGERPRDESLNVAELAAWTMIANLILNLDETLTKG